MFRILIAEDDPSTARLLGAIVKREGYEPLIAADGVQALEMLDHNHIDLLLCDVMMPRMDGFTLTRQWRGAQYDITVENPEHVSKGVCQIFLDGALTEKIPVQEAGSTHKVRIVMGSTQDEKEEAK